jgi:diguanylate cyclase (GGDEF)-like protein/PAS domain S-box-containing protein
MLPPNTPVSELGVWVPVNRLAVLSLTLLGMVIAIIAIRAVKRAVLNSNAQFKELIEHAVDAIVIVDPQSHRVLYTNAALQSRLGMTREYCLKLALESILISDEQTIEALNSRFFELHPQPIHVRHVHMEGYEIDVEARLSLLRMDGRVVWAYTTRDVSLQKKAEQQLIDNQNRLDQIANHDQLTGLPNRHYMAAFLPGAIESAKASASMIGIVFIDLDRFKNINDTQGHETGDQLLQVVAQRLRKCVRDADVVVRMGGDEFVIIFRAISSYEEVTRSANRIIDSLSAPVLIGERQLQASASLGISVYPRDGSNMVELLKNVQIFDPIMNKKLKHRVKVEAMLREALARKQLEVHYQPFINLNTRAIVGLEALVRWRHPVRGVIPADWFIPVAEETGLVNAIGEVVLQRALEDMTS